MAKQDSPGLSRSSAAGVWFVAACIVPAVMPLTTCSSDGDGDGDCEAPGGVDLSAQLSLQDDVGPAKTSYAFDVQSLSGGNKLFTFSVSNTASVLAARPLLVSSIAISETDGLGKPVADGAFSCLAAAGKPCGEFTFPPVVPEGWLATAKCPPDGAVTTTTFTIRYQHAPENGVRKARVIVKVNGDPAYIDKPVVLEFASAEGDPRLKCPTELVEFGLLKKGASACVPLKCTNTGNAPLRLEKAELLSSADPPMEVTFATATVNMQTTYAGSPVVEVAVGTALTFNFCLSKLPDESPIGATFRITSNDLEEPVKNIMVQANSSGPCYLPTPSDVDWGEVPVGDSVPKEIKLQSCGSEKVAIVKINLTEDSSLDFKLDFATSAFPASQHGTGPTEAAPLEILVGGSTPFFRVRCEPGQMSETPSSGSLRITNSDGETKQVPLSCQPAQVAKPEACFEVFVNGEVLTKGAPVIPQTALTFKCTCSKSPDGGQVVPTWSPPKQPKGFQGVLVPSPKACPVAFTPNIAGDYEFCLTVSDGSGNTSAPVCRTIQVVPDNKIHVELTWTQAGDKDAEDTKGSDLDLHVAHPLAPQVLSKNLITGTLTAQQDHDGDGEPDPWFAQCYDCFWLTGPAVNPPNWPTEGNTKDDPHVDLDDQDGWGPENISMEYPQTNEGYWIGVFAWDDAGMGPSVPTVTVYRDKVVLKKIVGPAMDKDDMWCVGRVKWIPGPPSPQDWMPCPGAKGGVPLLTKNYPNPAKDPTSFSFECPPTLAP